MKNGTAKVACSCTHTEQDKMHGVGVRVANSTQKNIDKDRTEVRCTVCGRLHQVSDSKVR